MTIKYALALTPLAEAFALAHADCKTVIETALQEIDDMAIPNDDCLHGQVVFSVGGQLFVGKGDGRGTLIIDTATYEDHGVLDAGPFKGKRIMIPRGDTEDR